MVYLGWLALGLIALVAGAELIIRGGSRLAARLGIEPIVIGLTIVSVGTSTPELAVGIEAGVRGNGPLAVANIAGTNTVNILLILGLSALLRPLAITLQTLRFDLPVMAAVAIAFLLMARDGIMTRAEGLVLVAAGVVFTALVVRTARRESRRVREEFGAQYAVPASPGSAAAGLLDLAWLLAGLAIIVVGSDWLVDGAANLARSYGVSESLIGLTIVAIGTSSPELVTTLVGTIRNDRDIAVGTLIGSSVYNVLIILGVACVVPASGLVVGAEVARVDIPVMTAAALVCLPVFLSGRSVTRFEGGAFVAAYAAYVAFVLITRT